MHVDACVFSYSYLEVFDSVFQTFIAFKVLKLCNLGLQGSDVEEHTTPLVDGRNLGFKRGRGQHSHVIRSRQRQALHFDNAGVLSRHLPVFLSENSPPFWNASYHVNRMLIWREMR